MWVIELIASITIIICMLYMIPVAFIATVKKMNKENGMGKWLVIMVIIIFIVVMIGVLITEI